MKKAFIVVLSLILLAGFVSAIPVDIKIQDTENSDFNTNCTYTEGFSGQFIRGWLDHTCLAGKEADYNLAPGWHFLSLQADNNENPNQGVAAKILVNGKEIATSTSWKNCYNSEYGWKCVDPYDNLGYALIYDDSELISGADTIWSGASANFILVSYKFEVKEVACYTNNECDDNNDYTQDVCVNPGTAESSCQHNNLQCILDSDCNSFDKGEISTCNYNPDNNPFTLDYFGGFNSVCQNNVCKIGSVSLTHTFEIGKCGVSCLSDNDCSSDEECENYKCEEEEKEENHNRNNLRIINDEPVSQVSQERVIQGTTEDSIVLGEEEAKKSNLWLWILLILIIILVVIILIILAMR